MSPISINGLPPDREDEAARVLARAFVTNPLHVSVFGPNQIAANTLLWFRWQYTFQ
jgi:hypothetical protein